MSALKSVLLAIDVATRQREDAGKVLLQFRPAAYPPKENGENGERIPADQGGQMFPHHVRFD